MRRKSVDKWLESADHKASGPPLFWSRFGSLCSCLCAILTSMIIGFGHEWHVQINNDSLLQWALFGRCFALCWTDHWQARQLASCVIPLPSAIETNTAQSSLSQEIKIWQKKRRKQTQSASRPTILAVAVIVAKSTMNSTGAPSQFERRLVA